MALKDELNQLITKFDAATNAVAARIDALKTQVADLLNNPDSVTPEEKAQIEASFQAEIDKLGALGADPANPVPGA